MGSGHCGSEQLGATFCCIVFTDQVNVAERSPGELVTTLTFVCIFNCARICGLIRIMLSPYCLLMSMFFANKVITRLTKMLNQSTEKWHSGHSAFYTLHPLLLPHRSDF